MKQIRYILFGLLSASASFASADPVHALRALEALTVRPADNPEPGACDWSKVKSACTNSTDSLTFNGCTIAKGNVLMQGSLDQAFSGTGADQCTMPLVNGETVTHTSKGLTLQFPSRESLAIDTAASQAYDGTEIPATGVVSAMANDVTTININGAHAIFKDAEGKVAEEILALSTVPVTVSGKHDDGTFAVNQGTVRAFHQVDKYTSEFTLDKLAWSDKACCHPVSGKISEVMSGSKTGTRSLAFSQKCGTAVLTEADGSVKDIALPACQ